MFHYHHSALKGIGLVCVHLVCVHLHEALVELHYHERASHGVVFPENSALQDVHQSLVGYPGLYPKRKSKRTVHLFTLANSSLSVISYNP
jgi:hypothetical protein